MIFAAECLQWLFYVAGAIHARSLRQSVTPDHMQGRVNGAYRFVTVGISPLGSVIGGFSGVWIGLPWTLVVCEIGFLFCVVWLIFSPIRNMRTFPEPEPALPLAAAI